MSTIYQAVAQDLGFDVLPRVVCSVDCTVCEIP